MQYHPPSHIRQLAHAALGEPIAHFERADGSIVIVMRDGRKVLFPAAETCQAPVEAEKDQRRRRDSDHAAPPSRPRRAKRKSQIERPES